MTTITRHRGRTSIAISLIAALLLALPLHSVRAASTSNLVVPPDQAGTVSGNTYGGWSAVWWQFVSSIPASDNPLLDQTGADCSVGQSGSVWFLVGLMTSGQVTRTCSIPSGKILFFPIVNCFDAADGTVDHERSVCKGQIDGASGMSAEVDGTSIQGLNTPDTIYRAQSPVFSLTLPPNNIYGARSGTYKPAVADGIYLMLYHPLPAGQHTVHFRAQEPASNFKLDVTYNLTVSS